MHVCGAAGGAAIDGRPRAARHQHAVAAPPPTIAPCAPLCAHARYHYTMPGPHSGPDCIILGGDTYHSTCVVMTRMMADKYYIILWYYTAV
jgi:hypothetical protein